jgi:hypothetical protein
MVWLWHMMSFGGGGFLGAGAVVVDVRGMVGGEEAEGMRFVIGECETDVTP